MSRSTKLKSPPMPGIPSTVTLTNISPTSWEHPTDRAALGALQQIPGFDALLRKVIGMFGERNIRMSYQAEAVKVGPRQYSDIHHQLVAVCETLDTAVPPLYISQMPLANSGAIGVDTPFIVLNSSLVELCKPEHSCDRAGLLVTQNVEDSFGLLAITAGGIRGRTDEIDLEGDSDSAENADDSSVS